MSDKDEDLYAPRARVIADFLRSQMDMDGYGYFIAVFPLDTEGLTGVEGVFSENMNPEFLGEALKFMADRVLARDVADVSEGEKPN